MDLYCMILMQYLHHFFCHSSFRNKGVQLGVQKISKLDGTIKENVLRLLFSEIWGRDWKVCHVGERNT